jgi:hypothetical protein
MIEVHKARALVWVLAQLAEGRGVVGNNLQHALDYGPEEAHGWLAQVVGDGLQSAFTTIEHEYRKARAPEGPHVVGWSPGAVRDDAWLRRQIEGLDRGGES